MPEKVRVLYVEDSPLDRELVREALQGNDSGFDLTTSGDRQEFERHLKQEKWDVILSDLNILGYSGLQVIKTVKTYSPETPVIIITGTGSEEMAAQAIKTGASDYVIKTTSHIRRLPESIRKAIQLQKAENEKALLLARLQTTLEATADGILVVDRQGRQVLASKRFAKMWNIPDAILQSKDDAEILNFVLYQLQDPEGFLRKVNELYADPEAKSFDTLEFKDGRIFERYSRPQVLNNEVIGRVWSFRNVTQQKQAEKRLRDSEENYRLLAETTSDFIVVHDLSDQILYMNQAALDFSGMQESDVLGASVFDFIPPEYHPQLLNRGKQREQGYSGKHLYELEFVNSDGRRTPIEVSSTSFLYQGKGRCILIVARDISRRKQLETQLQQAQKMEAIGTLSGGIAHDFNNILGIILGYTEIAQHEIPSSSPVQASLHEVKKASLRARDIVKQLLTFSRKGPAEHGVADIRPIIKEGLHMLRSTIPTSIEFQTVFPEELPSVSVDPTQMHQILMNLCTNAVQAMDEGGILEITLEPVSLSQPEKCFEGNLSPGAFVKLCVKDNGPGISRENLQRIFDPYFTTKEVGRGSGLGLSVVLGIVKSHGGGVTVESEPGAGTQFDIYLPAAEQKAAVPELEKPRNIPGGREQILFIDDEEPIVQLNQQRLEHLGYSATSSTDPLKAVELIQDDPQRFDLVITDMTMPKMTGDRLAQEIWRIKPGLPVILCTGHSERISEDSAKDLGLARYLEKPVDLQTLALSVREVLDGS